MVRFLLKSFLSPSSSNINIWLLSPPVSTRVFSFPINLLLWPWSQTDPWQLSEQGDFLLVWSQPYGYTEHCLTQWNLTPLKRSLQTLSLQGIEVNHDLLNLHLRSIAIFIILLSTSHSILFEVFFFFFFNGNPIFTLLSAWKACETFPGAELS